MRSGKLVPEQSDFAQLMQLLCINPSGVLADTTSLYTREALLPSSSVGAVEASLIFAQIRLHFAGNYGIVSIALPRHGRRLAPLAGAASDPRLHGRG